MSSPIETDAAVRRVVPRVFGAFFGRFPRLTDIQVRAVPAIVTGDDVLICAPTGTGKTEAYVSPVVERLLTDSLAGEHPSGERSLTRRSSRERSSVEGGGGLRFVIVSPTRALANDLHRRLAPVFETLGVPFGRYTGEHKERYAGRMPDVAVTTPEALDSMLSRRPGVLATVAAIALDEIHVLDGTARGDQLRVLLHRLEGVADRPPQRLAASATVPDPHTLAARYLRAPRVVASPGGRPIRARAFTGRGVGDMARHVDVLAEGGCRKVLVFCNSRRDVEELAFGLRGATRFAAAVHPHHGSLARAERERTERRFLEAPAAVAVATLTLELGIDIGSVDYVLLSGPPSSVSSLLQRIGRGGRRSEGPARAGYAFTDEAERMLFRALLGCAARGDLCADATDFRPSVLVQQAIVLAGGRGTVTAEDLRATLPDDVRAGLPVDAPEQILGAMVEHEMLEAPLAGRHVLAARTEAAYEMGRVHGNIDDDPNVQVVDRLTGDVIGEVARSRPGNRERVQLGGRSRRPVREIDGRLLTDASGAEGPARFRPRSAPALTFAFGRAFASDLGVAPDELVQGRLGTRTVLLHGLGALGGLFLSERVKASVGKDAVLGTTPMVLVLSVPLTEMPRPSEADVVRHVRAHEKRLARVLGMGPYHRKLPVELRLASVRRCSPLDAVASFLRDARLTIRPPSEDVPLFWSGL